MKPTERMKIPYHNKDKEYVRQLAIKHFEEIEDEIQNKIEMFRTALLGMGIKQRGEKLTRINVNHYDIEIRFMQIFKEYTR